MQVTQRNVGIGHRRHGPTTLITGRARIGASALRADSECSAAVDPSDAAATGANLSQVNRGHPQQVSATAQEPVTDIHGAADFVLVGEPWSTILDEAGFRGGATHTE